MAIYPSAPEDVSWHKSRTCDGGACVMVARHGSSVLLGSTEEPDGPVFAYTHSEWREFLAGAKLGDFDNIV